MKKLAWLLPLTIACGALFASSDAQAQKLPPPNRSGGLETVSNIGMVVSVAAPMLMPRFYWSDSEVTIGWKSRWHASVLAPTMLSVALGLFSESVIKPSITSYRPGCGPTNEGVAGCTTFGMPSTQTFIAFSGLGEGAGIFVVDTVKWNDGRVSGGAILGDVALPLLASGLTLVGRVAGTPALEHGDQGLVGAGLGLAVGLITGGAYALMQKPECPYGVGVICW